MISKKWRQNNKKSVSNSISDLQIHKALNQIEEIAKTNVKRFDKNCEEALEILEILLCMATLNVKVGIYDSGLYKRVEMFSTQTSIRTASTFLPSVLSWAPYIRSENSLRCCYSTRKDDDNGGPSVVKKISALRLLSCTVYKINFRYRYNLCRSLWGAVGE